MNITYFEKPYGVEYLIVDGYELKVSILLEIFKQAKKGKIKISSRIDDGVTLNNLMKLNAFSNMSNLELFERKCMKMLKRIWEKDREEFVTGID